MPYALIIAGIILTVAGVRNTQRALFTLLEGDFTGQGSFVWWTLSILAIGAIGYIPDLRKMSTAFLTLVFIVLFISNSKSGEGVAQKFVDALKSPIPPAPVGNSPAQTNAGASTQTNTNLFGTGLNLLQTPNL